VDVRGFIPFAFLCLAGLAVIAYLIATGNRPIDEPYSHSLVPRPLVSGAVGPRADHVVAVATEQLSRDNLLTRDGRAE